MSFEEIEETPEIIENRIKERKEEFDQYLQKNKINLDQLDNKQLVKVGEILIDNYLDLLKLVNKKYNITSTLQGSLLRAQKEPFVNREGLGMYQDNDFVPRLVFGIMYEEKPKTQPRPLYKEMLKNFKKKFQSQFPKEETKIEQRHQYNFIYFKDIEAIKKGIDPNGEIYQKILPGGYLIIPKLKYLPELLDVLVEIDKSKFTKLGEEENNMPNIQKFRENCLYIPQELVVYRKIKSEKKRDDSAPTWPGSEKKQKPKQLVVPLI